MDSESTVVEPKVQKNLVFLNFVVYLDENRVQTECRKMESESEVSIIKRRYAENPFLERGVFVVPTRKKATAQYQTSGPLTVVDNNSGEIVAGAEVRRIENIDSEKFVKVFVGQLSAFYDLKPGSMKILTMILHEAAKFQNINSDRIYLNYDLAKEHFGKEGSKTPARATFYSALAELTEKGFVAPSTKLNIWFTNPAIFFNGDRIQFVTELRRKRTTEHERLERAGQRSLPLE